MTITPDAQVRGAHEPMADELLVDERLVGFSNSWSPEWGFQGRFYLGWGDLERLLGEQGDVIVPVPLTSSRRSPRLARPRLTTWIGRCGRLPRRGRRPADSHRRSA